MATLVSSIYFLETGAKVDAQKDQGETALQLTAKKASARMVETLLCANEDANWHNHKGVTVLQTAARAGFVAIVRMLLDAGADVNAQFEPQKKTALQAAVKGGPQFYCQAIAAE